MTFQMAEAVIYFFEFVQIDQYHGEWPARTGRALPLRAKGLPEEASGLDAGEAVGNRLLL